MHIDLRGKQLRRLPDRHKWRALVEILTCGVYKDGSIVTDKTKKTVLKYMYAYAKLRIEPASTVRKFQNYRQADAGDISHCNGYTKDVYRDFADPYFEKIVQEVIADEWSAKTKRLGKPDIFTPHEVKLLYSPEYERSPYYPVLSDLDLDFFLRKIDGYLDNIFIHVTPQHYIEHADAIGHLDKILFVTKEEAEEISESLSENPPYLDINDFMGLFIPAAEITDRHGILSFVFEDEIKNDETLIFLCPENMDESMRSLKINHPTLEEMVDQVFSHEIGHLAFYFYYSELNGCECIRTIAEKQANWISSIAHNGAIDDLIEEITAYQPPKYHNPVLLKHKDRPDYAKQVEGLYLR